MVQLSKMVLPGVFGAGIFFIVSKRRSCNSGFASSAKRGPAAAISMFKYATTFGEAHVMYSSSHSVDPTRPYSSASHDAKTLTINVSTISPVISMEINSHIVLLGFQPEATNFPKALASSTNTAVAELGSAAPPTIQASLWFPMMTTSSAFVPLIMPMTSQISVMVSSITLFMVTTAPAAGPLE